MIDDLDYYAARKALTEGTTAAFPAVWLSALGLGPSLLAFGEWAWDNAGDRATVRIGASVGVFVRGMLVELDVTLGEWYAPRPHSPCGRLSESERSTRPARSTDETIAADKSWCTEIMMPGTVVAIAFDSYRVE